MPSVIHGLFIASHIVVFGISSLHALSIETVNVSKNKEKSGPLGSEPISASWLSLRISRRLSVFFLRKTVKLCTFLLLSTIFVVKVQV